MAFESVYTKDGERFTAPINLDGSANLSGLNLKGCVFEGDWRWTKFTGANLFGAQFQNVDVSYSSFNEATLHYADFSGAKMHAVSFMGAKAHGVKFVGADLLCAILRGVELRDSCLEGACFAGANLEGVNFEDSSGVRMFTGIAEWGNLYVFSEKWIKVGCRWFTLGDALKHWEGRPGRENTLKLVKMCAENGWVKE